MAAPRRNRFHRTAIDFTFMNLKLACADFTFPLLLHDKVLDLVAALEMHGIDIGLFEGRSHLWPSREFRNVAQSARELRAKLDARGLKAADVFLQMDPDFVPYAINHPESRRRRKARDWFLRTLDYANELGSPHVTTLPGVWFADQPEAVALGRSQEELAWRIEQAGDRGITFSIEAHVGSIVSSPREAAKLVSAVPGLTLTLDYTHFTRMGVADEKIEPLTAMATHFHVRGACKGRLQASFKDNTIDYARVLRALAKARYIGYLGIEYIWIDWQHCNEVDTLSETILYRDFLRRVARRR
jgi:sugar phosphate isomerase/epimerase